MRSLSADLGPEKMLKSKGILLDRHIAMVGMPKVKKTNFPLFGTTVFLEVLIQ